MNVKPKRRWYQFSLRTLLVVVTAVACLIVGVKNRADRMHRRAAEHMDKYIYFMSMRPRVTLLGNTTEYIVNDRYANWHREKAAACRLCAWMPWMSVLDTPPDGYVEHAEWRKRYDEERDAEVRLEMEMSVSESRK